MKEKSILVYALVLIASLVFLFGIGMAIYFVLTDDGFMKGIGPAFALITLMGANAFSLPFVFGYWLLTGKPTKACILMIVQSLGILIFVLLWFWTTLR